MTSAPHGPRTLASSDFDLSDGLGAESDNPALRSLIIAEIRARGPMTFRRFMELALYHPTEGYYASERERIGRNGDYVTSPEITPLFGYALAKQLAELWRCLGSPRPFSITEHGAGNGRLARDILRWIEERDPVFYDALVYSLIEVSRPLRALQSEALAPQLRTGKVDLANNAPPGPGCVLANELLDSFPVHRVSVGDGKLHEIYVGLRGDEFVEQTGKLLTPQLAGYFSRLGLLPGEGCVAEVNLDVGSWLTTAAERLSSGFLLLLDYGHIAERMYAPWRRQGTLLTYHRHEAGEDPYRYAGQEDITSHVDLTNLICAAGDTGLEVIGYTDQTRFLTGLGIERTLQPGGLSRDSMGDYYSRRRAVEALLDPVGLGRVAVVLLGKSAAASSLSGFQQQLQAPLPVPQGSNAL